MSILGVVETPSACARHEVVLCLYATMNDQSAFQEKVYAAIDSYSTRAMASGARRSRRSCNRIDEQCESSDLLGVLGEFSEIIHEHWNHRPIQRSNWRWRTETRPFSKEKREVWLERTIFSAHHNDEWTYQIPTSSGLFAGHGGRRRSLDLVHRVSPSVFEFIEMKDESNNAFFAAFEILLYGALYLFARSRDENSLPHRAEPGFELLQATHIDLEVLAPQRYYRGRSLVPFENALNDAVRAFAAQSDLGVTMAFSYKAWPELFPSGL